MPGYGRVREARRPGRVARHPERGRWRRSSPTGAWTRPTWSRTTSAARPRCRAHLLERPRLPLADPDRPGGASRPGARRWSSHVRAHEAAFAGMPAYMHDAILPAYLQSALHRHGDARDAGAVHGARGRARRTSAAFYRQIAQMDTALHRRGGAALRRHPLPGADPLGRGGRLDPDRPGPLSSPRRSPAPRFRPVPGLRPPDAGGRAGGDRRRGLPFLGGSRP